MSIAPDAQWPPATVPVEDLDDSELATAQREEAAARAQDIVDAQSASENSGGDDSGEPSPEG